MLNFGKCFFLCSFIGILSFAVAQGSEDSSTVSPETAELLQRIEKLEAEKQELVQRLREVQEKDGQAESQQAEEATSSDYFELSLEELMDIKLPSSASLTKTKRRLTPATMTTITNEQIRRSGARSLYELFEMYVPNFQMIFVSAHPKSLGLRGINGSRSDKLLLLVNGRIMNERTDFGVQTEVDLPMLMDIHHIDIVRGPSSALYGPGALSMTISIVTDNARTFEGEEIRARYGEVEEFQSFEYKRGKKLGKNKGYFFYAGVTNYDGVSGKSSPTVLSTAQDCYLRNYGPYEWIPFNRGMEVDWFAKNLNQMPHGLPKMKMYYQYTDGDLDLWGRYTQGGQWIDFLDWSSNARRFSNESLTYTQLTVQANYKQELTQNLSIDYMISYDTLKNENENRDTNLLWKNFSEDEVFGKILARWNPRENHSLAFGGEWSHETFGKGGNREVAICYQPFKWHYAESWGWMPRWSTDRRAILGEYQWGINDQFTLFLSGRVDLHPYTKALYSPRGVLVYTPTKKDTFKFMASKATRTNSASQMWIDYNYHHVKSEAEKLNAYELRYERQHTDTLWLGSSLFYHDHDALASTPSNNTGTVMVGNVKSYGLELEGGYHTDKFRLDASYSYTKLDKIELAPGITLCEISTAPFGYGEDFANWYNQTAKIRAEYDLDEKWTLNGSLYVGWDNAGGPGWAEWVDLKNTDRDSYDEDFDIPFTANAYLNLGAEYKWSENTTLQLTGYNLLGWFNDRLNKRRIGFDQHLPARYRIQPVSVAVSLTHKF